MVKNNAALNEVSDDQLISAFENAEKSTLYDLNIYLEMHNALSKSGKYTPVVHTSFERHIGEYDVVRLLDATIKWAERFAKIYGDIKKELNEQEPSFIYLFAHAEDAQSDREGTFEDITKLFAKATIDTPFEDVAPVYAHILKEENMVRQSGTDLLKMLYPRMENENVRGAEEDLNRDLSNVQDYPKPRDLIYGARLYINCIESNAKFINVEPSAKVRELRKEINRQAAALKLW